MPRSSTEDVELSFIDEVESVATVPMVLQVVKMSSIATRVAAEPNDGEGAATGLNFDGPPPLNGDTGSDAARAPEIAEPTVVDIDTGHSP